MLNFIFLVILPMLFFGIVIAIFMYCAHYLLAEAKSAVKQAMQDENKATNDSTPQA